MKKVLLFTSLLVLAGCYHATVDTGLAPAQPTVNSETIWAHSWVYGLVPPSTVRAQDACGGPATRVDTQVGFVHGLIGAITGGIYTPMQIRVTCAAN